MPIYLDHHKGVPTREQIEAARKAIKSGMTSPEGVRAINGFVGKGESWCLNEAPSLAVVHKLHESLGIRLGSGDVVEVQAVV